jgi:hypothetical protein
MHLQHTKLKIHQVCRSRLSALQTTGDRNPVVQSCLLNLIQIVRTITDMGA